MHAVIKVNLLAAMAGGIAMVLVCGDKHGAKEKHQPMRAVKDAAQAAIERALTNARVLGLPRSVADEKFKSWALRKGTP